VLALPWSEKLYWAAASVIVGCFAILFGNKLVDNPSWEGFLVAVLFISFNVLFFVGLHLHTRMIQRARARNGRSAFSPLILLDAVVTTEFYWFFLCLILMTLTGAILLWLMGIDPFSPGIKVIPLLP
jgi:hypothetical protein